MTRRSINPKFPSDEFEPHPELPVLSPCAASARLMLKEWKHDVIFSSREDLFYLEHFCTQYKRVWIWGSTQVAILGIASDVRQLYFVSDNYTGVTEVDELAETTAVLQYAHYLDMGGFDSTGQAKDKQNPNITEYQKMISQLTEEPFELAIIAGPYRVACSLHAYMKLSGSGVLLVHGYEKSKHGKIASVFNHTRTVGETAEFRRGKPVSFSELAYLAREYQFKSD